MTKHHKTALPVGESLPPSPQPYTVSFSAEWPVTPKRDGYTKPPVRVRAINGFLENEEGHIMQFSSLKEANAAREEFVRDAPDGVIAFVNYGCSRMVSGTLATLDIETRGEVDGPYTTLGDILRAALDKAPPIPTKMDVATALRDYQNAGNVLRGYPNAYHGGPGWKLAMGVLKTVGGVTGLVRLPESKFAAVIEACETRAQRIRDGVFPNIRHVATALQRLSEYVDSNDLTDASGYDVVENIVHTVGGVGLITELDPDRYQAVIDECTAQRRSLGAAEHAKPMDPGAPSPFWPDGCCTVDSKEQVAVHRGETIREAVARHCGVTVDNVRQDEDGTFHVLESN